MLCRGKEKKGKEKITANLNKQTTEQNKKSRLKGGSVMVNDSMILLCF